MMAWRERKEGEKGEERRKEGEKKRRQRRRKGTD
jgi:hypothetical protein